MKKNEPVSQIMSKELVTVHHGEPFSAVRKKAQEHGVHHIPVVNGRELVGMISWTDIMRVSFADAFHQDPRAVDATLDHTFKLEDIMCKDPVSLQMTASIRDAAEILSNSDFHCLPVCNGKELVGLVTTTDMIRYLREQM